MNGGKAVVTTSQLHTRGENAPVSLGTLAQAFTVPAPISQPSDAAPNFIPSGPSLTNSGSLENDQDMDILDEEDGPDGEMDGVEQEETSFDFTISDVSCAVVQGFGFAIFTMTTGCFTRRYHGSHPPHCYHPQ